MEQRIQKLLHELVTIKGVDDVELEITRATLLRVEEALERSLRAVHDAAQELSKVREPDDGVE